MTPKEIMKFYVADSKDSFFVHGIPPAETVEVVAYDPSWPQKYEKIERFIKNALGSNLQTIDHIGSTSIPNISAKPVIDIDLSVSDPADENSYLSALEKLGFKLIVREPRFYGHRLLHLAEPRVNLHVFSTDCPETIRHLLFRDWLRKSKEDRQLYANAKLDAVKDSRLDIEKYHENKKHVVHEIYRKIFKSLGFKDSDEI